MTIPTTPSSEGADGWQDIASAVPGRIMVTDGAFFGVGSSLGERRYVSWNNFFEPFDVIVPDWHKPNCIVATHWRPLPKPPSASQPQLDGENRK